MGKTDDNIQKIKKASDAILGKSLDNLKEIVIEFAKRGDNIFLAGARGVGKELFANLYGAASGRKMCPINMTGIPTELVDSTLFGYVEGAYSGAMKGGADGLITQKNAQTSCFFFDELGDIPINIQAKLLRFVQFGEIQKVGEPHPVKIDYPGQLQIVAATNKPDCIRDDLKDRFRCLRIPTLVERHYDIPLLMKHFLNDSAITGITKYALDGLHKIRYKIMPVIFSQKHEEPLIGPSYIYPWPGNIRELKNVIKNAIYLCNKRGASILGSEDFPTITWPHEQRNYSDLNKEEEDREMGKLERPAILKHYDKLRGSWKSPYDNCELYDDKEIHDYTEILPIADLQSCESIPFPYHYFFKNILSEFSKEDMLKEENTYLDDLDWPDDIMTPEDDEIHGEEPAQIPTLENQITYDNTAPPKYENDFYEYHVKKGTPNIKLVGGYKTQGLSISRNTVSKRLKSAKERLNID